MKKVFLLLGMTILLFSCSPSPNSVSITEKIEYAYIKKTKNIGKIILPISETLEDMLHLFNNTRYVSYNLGNINEEMNEWVNSKTILGVDINKK